MLSNKENLRKELWQRVEDALFALYGDAPDSHILNRFYSEKMFLGDKDDIILWNITADIRIEAKHGGYLTNLTGTDSSCFVAYLIGASDINPLPLHYRCPDCGKIEFIENKRALPVDVADKPCECGHTMRADGFDIPYEMYMGKRAPWTHLNIAYPFIQTAEKIVREKAQGIYRIVKLTKPNFEPLKFVFLPYDGNPDFEENVDTVDDKYLDFPQITMTARLGYDAAIKLTNTTGIDFYEILEKISNKHLSESLLISEFANGNTDGVLGFDFRNHPRLVGLKEDLQIASPQSSYDLLKFLGAIHGTRNWLYNGNKLVKDGLCKIGDLPSHRDDIFMLLRDEAEVDANIALTIANKKSKRLRSNELTDNERNLLEKLDMPTWFVPYIEKVRYMGSKSAVIGTLRIALAFMWYKINYPEKFEM